MNILPSIFRKPVQFLEQNVLSSLTPQQQRIGAAALIALSFVAACYAIYRCCSYKAIKADVLKEEPIKKPAEVEPIKVPLDIPEIPLKAKFDFQKGIEKFSFKLLQERIGDSKTDNQLISPLGISFLLSMIKHGVAPVDKAEIERIVNLPKDEEGLKVSALELIKKLKDGGLDIAGLLYLNPQYRLNPKYQELASEFYQSKVECGASAEEVNEWVKMTTHEQIEQIITQEDLDKLFVVLANAIHFKAKWSNEFEATATHSAVFVTPAKTVQVEMMHQTNEVGYFEDDHCQAIKLSYSDKSEFSMLLILPKKDNNFAFINASNFEAISQGMANKCVKIALPKFKLEQEIDVKAMLGEIGMKGLFGKPDFSPLVDVNHPPSKAALPSLVIGKMVQKSALACDEEGTEASSVTAALIVEESCRMIENEKEINFNRPFLAALVSTGAPILFGVVRDPSAKQIQLKD